MCFQIFKDVNKKQVWFAKYILYESLVKIVCVLKPFCCLIKLDREVKPLSTVMIPLILFCPFLNVDKVLQCVWLGYTVASKRFFQF